MLEIFIAVLILFLFLMIPIIIIISIKSSKKPPVPVPNPPQPNPPQPNPPQPVPIPPVPNPPQPVPIPPVPNPPQPNPPQPYPPVPNPPQPNPPQPYPPVPNPPQPSPPVPNPPVPNPPQPSPPVPNPPVPNPPQPSPPVPNPPVPNPPVPNPPQPSPPPPSPVGEKFGQIIYPQTGFFNGNISLDQNTLKKFSSYDGIDIQQNQYPTDSNGIPIQNPTLTFTYNLKDIQTPLKYNYLFSMSFGTNIILSAIATDSNSNIYNLDFDNDEIHNNANPVASKIFNFTKKTDFLIIKLTFDGFDSKVTMNSVLVNSNIQNQKINPPYPIASGNWNSTTPITFLSNISQDKNTSNNFNVPSLNLTSPISANIVFTPEANKYMLLTFMVESGLNCIQGSNYEVSKLEITNGNGIMPDTISQIVFGDSVTGYFEVSFNNNFTGSSNIYNVSLVPIS